LGGNKPEYLKTAGPDVHRKMFPDAKKQEGFTGLLINLILFSLRKKFFAINKLAGLYFPIWFKVFQFCRVKP
jgi:hypothetical protein